MFEPIILAQSTPTGERPVQRTIEVEEDIQPAVEKTESQAGQTVFLGLGAIMLLLIAIGAATLLWSKYPIGGQSKASEKKFQKPDLL